MYDESRNLLYSKQTELQKGWYFLDYLNEIFENHQKIIFEKEVIGYSENITYFKDSIIIDKNNIESYKKLKNYNKI